MNTSHLRAAPTGYNAVTSIHNEDPNNVTTMRKPASAYIMIDSRDRYVNADPRQTRAVDQPWNNFIVQKAQSIIPTFAKRIDVTEVRFPWYIPNITKNNNMITFAAENGDGDVVIATVSITTGFYSPEDLATALNDAINLGWDAAGLDPADAPEYGWDAANSTFIITNAPQPYYIVSQTAGGWGNYGPSVENAPNVNYLTQPSLALTIGVPIYEITTNLDNPIQVAFYQATSCLYTNYVDIVSDKLMRYADQRDGGSGQLINGSILCRIYCADEISIYSTAPVGTAPFVIHRQFKTPKSIQWEPKSFVGDFDIEVFDQYGQLVPLNLNLTTYPDFQLTLLASEN